jgi:molybdopterin-guanine dinucleotide biosynthesis protein A
MKYNINLFSAIVLSGGQGSRMGYRDKGLVRLDGKPLVQHVLDRVIPQVNEIVISCNRNTTEYQKVGYPIVKDILPDYPGPLAGVLSAGMKVSSPVTFIIPSDMPFIPLDIVFLLFEKMKSHRAITALVNDKLEPLVSLVQTESIATVSDYLLSGQHSVRGWLKLLGGIVTPIDAPANAFRNMNSPLDLS